MGPKARFPLGATALGWIAGLCALMIVLYPGLFLAKNRSIPFWNTPWLLLVLVAYAATGPSALALLGWAFVKEAPHYFESVGAVLLVVSIVLTIGYLWAMDRAGGPDKASVQLLNQGPLRWMFRIGVVLTGWVMPLVVLLWFPAAGFLAGLCMLIGGLLFRYCILKAGAYVLAPVVQAGVDSAASTAPAPNSSASTPAWQVA